MKNLGNKRKKQRDGRFYSSLLSLPYHYLKWRLAKAKIRFHCFRNLTIAVTIFCFSREEKFSGLLLKVLIKGRL